MKSEMKVHSFIPYQRQSDARMLRYILDKSAAAQAGRSHHSQNSTANY